jgi:hypothetical protein
MGVNQREPKRMPIDNTTKSICLFCWSKGAPRPISRALGGTLRRKQDGIGSNASNPGRSP